MVVAQNQSLSRQQVDQWPIATAGLTARVVHCLDTAGVRTIGELRRWNDQQLMALRSFGVGSLDSVHKFFRWAQRLEAGHRPTLHLRALMREFLNDQEVFVIEHRYGLKDPLFRPTMKRRTLQSIARLSGGLTRERVRQVEESALTRLREKLCMAVSEELTAHWLDHIRSDGGIVPSSALGAWAGDSMLGGYQPWGALLLLSESQQRILYRYDCFSCLTATQFDKLEKRVLQIVQKASAPVPIAEIQNAAREELAVGPNPAWLVAGLLDHHPNIDGTADRRYFSPRPIMPKLLAEILREQTEPIHFYKLTELYNKRIAPQSHRSPAYIQYILAFMPEAVRVRRAHYELKPR